MKFTISKNYDKHGIMMILLILAFNYVFYANLQESRTVCSKYANS